MILSSFLLNIQRDFKSFSFSIFHTNHFDYKPPFSFKMASNMTVVQHSCNGFLRFILPEDTVTVDMEVMTLKGIHIFRQDKHSNEKKMFIPWSEHNEPPSSFYKRLRETQDKPSREFLESFVDQNLEANSRPKTSCKCPKVAIMSDRELIQDAKLRKARQMDNVM